MSRMYVMPTVWFAILVGVIAFPYFYWKENQVASRTSIALQALWDSSLYHYYHTNRSWSGIEPWFEELVSVQPARIEAFQLSNRTGSRIYRARYVATGHAFQLENRPILHEGAIVGYYDIAWAHKEPYISAFRSSLKVGALSGAGFFAILYRFRRRQAAQSRAVNDIFAAMLDRGQIPDEQQFSSVADPAIRANLRKAIEHMNKLEVVRRRMVADFSHELRTPISLMRMKLESALEKQTPVDIESTYSILEEVYRMSKLVQDLQQLSLAETGNLSLQKRWINICELVEDTVDLLLPGAEGKELTLEFEAGRKLLVYVDPDRYQQVLINLLGNAIRHSRLRLKLRVWHENSLFIIEVEDDGVGIEEEELEHIFERFYRSSASPERDKGRGMGLGLAIARSLVLAHGGTIQVRSKYGEGSIFRVATAIFRE
ncbi:sensor histidine kinase [Paenibacillus xanthanilyticus]|uniref:histidine kinase n=1 Tax=Paenibacillus xanthanilyticus TaxID=1783531 RepID=A0ABV8JXJ1_9BACL